MKKENMDDELEYPPSNHQTHQHNESVTSTATDEFYEFYCMIPASYFSEPATSKPPTQLHLTDSARRSFFHYLRQQLVSSPHPAELLTQCHTIYLCYCINNAVADRPLSVLCDNLIVTAVRLMAACFAATESAARLLNPIQCSIEIRRASYYESDPDPKDETFNDIIVNKEFHASAEYIPVALFAAFVDYAIHMNFVTRDDWKEVLPEIHHPFTLITKCLTELSVIPFPMEYSRKDIGSFVILFMFCAIEKARGVQTRTVSRSTQFVQTVFHNLCDTVLEDIINPSSNNLLDLTPATFYTFLKKWTTN